MKPLAKDPWSKKFCAAKFPSETVSAREIDEVSAELEKRGTPYVYFPFPYYDNKGDYISAGIILTVMCRLWTQMGMDEKDVLETFCRCNFGAQRGRGSSARKYRGRIRRWAVEEDE